MNNTIVKMEKEMTDVLLENRNTISKSVSESDAMIEEVSRLWPSDNQQAWVGDNLSEIVGNPIHAFQAIRRMSVKWKSLESKLAKSGSGQVVRSLIEVRKRYGVTVSDEDLAQASVAIEKLRSLYGFDIGEFADGNILGEQTSAKMTAEDLLNLVQTALWSPDICF